MLRRDRLVWLVFAWTVPFVIVLEGVNVVEVFLVRDDLGASATSYGLLQAFFGAGAVVGSWLAGRCVHRRAAGAAAARSASAVRRSAIVLAGVSPTVAFLAAVAGPARRCPTGRSTPRWARSTSLRTAEAERGRVLAAVSGVSRTGSVLALGLGGLAGGLLGARRTFVVGGGLALLVVAALVLVAARRRADRTGRAVLEPALAT